MNISRRAAIKRFENLKQQIAQEAESNEAITLKDGRYEVSQNTKLKGSGDWVVLSGSAFDADPTTTDKIKAYKPGDFFSESQSFVTRHSREGLIFKKDREYLTFKQTEITPAGNSSSSIEFRI